MIDDLMAEVRRLLEAADFDSALRLSEQCLSLAETFSDPVLKAKAMVTRGIALARVHEDAKALSYYDDALRIYEHAGEELLAARARQNRILSYCHLSRYDDAVRDGNVNIAVLERLGEKQMLARTLTNVSEALFRADRFQEWMAALDRAAALFREMGDTKSLATVYMNQAVALTSLNRASEAVHYYQLAKQFAEETGQSWLAAVIDYNLGYLHYIQGEYTKALEILNATRAALGTENWHATLCDLTQSEIFLEMNMPREAIDSAQRAHQAFAGQEKTFEMTKAVGVMAIAHSQLRQFKRAADLFEEARAMFSSQGNEVRAATMNLYKGLMWLRMGRYAEAKAIARQAGDVFKKEGVNPKAAFACILSARASLTLADVEGAGADAAAAVALHQDSPVPSVAQQIHSLLGEIHLARNDAQAAREEFSKAIDEMERVRVNIASDDLRLNFLKDKVPVFEKLLTTDLQVGQPDTLREAFVTTERARSRTLVDLLAGSVDSLRQVSASSVEEVQQALAPEAALVEYVITGDTVTAFFLSRDRFDVLQAICSRTELKERFDFLQYHLARLGANPSEARARSNVALANIQDHVSALYKMLIAPLEGLLSGRTSLIFVPFDFLHYLPFHALFDGHAYLADRFTITYAPSATIYRLFNSRPVDATRKALLVGVADERAPFITREIDSISSVLPNARTILGGEATKERLAEDMADSGIIHIASHAVFRPDNPMFSSIELHDGSLNFFDIYHLRTKASLITLSGCGTGLSNVVAGDELLGLVRGFLYAGTTSIVTSLWDVSDETTADLMKYFYSSLAAGESKASALSSAMKRLRDEHPHPYYWAPFLLVGDPS